MIDSNDNAPKFLRDSYEAYVNETIRRGTTFLQVMARDLDEGNNGRVRHRVYQDVGFTNLKHQFYRTYT